MTRGEALEAEMTTGLAERSNKNKKTSTWPPYNVPVPGGDKWQIKRGSVAECYWKIKFLGAWGVSMQSLGWFNRGLVWVLDARAGGRESQPLSHHGGKKKLQYGFKNKHTNTPNKRCHRPMILTSAADSLTFSATLHQWRSFLLWHQWKTFLSFVVRLTFWVLTFFSDAMPRLLLAQLFFCFTKYFTISFTGETTCN